MQSELDTSRIIDLSSGRLRTAMKRAGLKLLPVLAGLLLSRTGVMGGMYPFGAALAASAPKGYALFSIAGVMLGLLLPGGPPETLRCAASALAVAGIRWALSELKGIGKSPLLPSASAFLGVMLTGMVVTSSVGAAISFDLALYAAESSLAAACAYFFHSAFICFPDRNGRRLSTQELCCLYATAAVLLIPLCRLEIFGFSPLTSVMLIIVLAAGAHRGATGGAVAGIAAGAIAALASGSFMLTGVCAAAGLVAALFSPVGALASSAVFAICCSLGVIASGRLDIFFIAECTLASTAYYFIKPDRLGFVFSLTERSEAVCSAAPPAGYVSERLRTAAKGLEHASKTVCEVSERLDRMDSQDAGIVCRRATEKICSDCAISSFCWKSARDETQRLFDSLTRLLSRDGRLSRENTPTRVRDRCARWGEMSDEINSSFAEYAARERSRRRISQVRAAISSQLGGVGELLCELANESGFECQDGERLSALSAQALGEYGIECRKSRCIKRPDGSLSLSLNVRLTDGRADETAEDAAVILSDALGERLCEQSRLIEGRYLLLELHSLPRYSVSFGAAQHCRTGEALCGDAYDALPPFDGEAVMLLSDGMGSGGRAAVDAAMTCGLLRQLIEAGFKESGAMRLVNAAIQIRSEDETLATADCARINLYTGEVSFHKAGAAASYVKRGREVHEINLGSLPLGIMLDADCARETLPLDPGDVVVLASDGLCAEEDGWVADELRRCSCTDARELARNLVALGAARSSGADDDITVLVMILCDAPEEAADSAA